MHRYTKLLAFAVIVALVPFGIFVTATAGPNPPPVDGSTTITCGVATTLFNGAVPPNGFMVQSSTHTFMVNDNGTASFAPLSGFLVLNTQVAGSMFVTPPGYRPMGVVSVFCPGVGTTAYIAARGW